MLVLTRKAQQQIRVGNNVVITILRVKGQSVRVGIDAPQSVRVVRAELPALGAAQQSETELALEIAPEKPLSVEETEPCKRNRSTASPFTTEPGVDAPSRTGSLPLIKHGLGDRLARRSRMGFGDPDRGGNERALSDRLTVGLALRS